MEVIEGIPIWKSSDCLQLPDHLKEEWEEYIADMRSQVLLIGIGGDRVIWGGSTNAGQILVAETYNKLSLQQHQLAFNQVYEKIWKNNAHLKMQISCGWY